ncbi:MAG: MraY family glycosyltransferase [Patescibacteria group bacterium]|jgi:UDP-GlcNAc:undecaprenyl-phosphate GlcNAc-1-phosphate transferase
MSQQTLLLVSCTILIGTALLSFVLTFVSRRLAVKYKALDIPKNPRKIHKSPIPLWGGLGISLALIIGVLAIGYFDAHLNWQIIGFLIGVVILCVGGMLDDVFEFKAWQSLIFPLLASIVVILTGTTIVHVTNPGTSSALFLNWWTWHPFVNLTLTLPSDLLTLIWLMVAIYATKITDGLDGLVTGITIIGAAMVGSLSAMPTYYQPISVLLASAVGGTYLGFLPKNIHPAKQFLGEAGSTIAGFCLGFLAIVSSAKIAIALAVLAIPVADVAFVVLRRLLSGHSPFSADSSHLHFRLLAAGVSHRNIVILLWVVSAAAGVVALTMQTRGKIFLVITLALLTVLVSWLADREIKRRGKL